MIDEHEKLQDPTNYKILIQLKKNRKMRLKTRYLTPDFDFSEDINEAMVFANFQEAESMMARLNSTSYKNSTPRIFVKYIEDMVKENGKTREVNPY